MKLNEATKEELLELIEFWLRETMRKQDMKKRLESQLFFIRSDKILKKIGEKLEQVKNLTGNRSKYFTIQAEICTLNEKLDKLSIEWEKEKK